MTIIGSVAISSGAMESCRRSLICFCTCIVLLCLGAISAVQAQDENSAWNQIKALQWVPGPTSLDVLSNATLNLPDHYSFLPIADTDKFMRITENPSDSSEQLFAPDDLRWFATLSFVSDGYVRDDEKIDSKSVLDSIRDGTEQANVERRKNGWPELHIVGWRREPNYDPTTKRLEWAVDAEDSTGAKSVNFQTRVLGRRGITNFTLVTDPEHIDHDIGEFNAILTGYEFNPGDRYAEFKSGDKVAEYGLAALIVGGGAAVAAKSGLLKFLGKFIWIAGVAVLVAVKSFFSKIFGRRKQS